jgi:hypothetical protein
MMFVATNDSEKRLRGNLLRLRFGSQRQPQVKRLVVQPFHVAQSRNDQGSPAGLCARLLSAASAETFRIQWRFFSMLKKLIEVEIVQAGDERFILKIFSDGSEERQPIVKLPRKKPYRPRPHWHWDLNKGRKRGF